MAKIKRVIRRLPPATATALDEQLWPVNLMLFVLGAFSTGQILVFADFTTPHVLANGWTWLAGVWGMLGLAILGTWRLGDRRGRRLQLSAVLAMLFLQVVLTYSAYQKVFFLRPFDEEETTRELAESREEPQPVFHPVVQHEEKFEHEKPVETEAPRETVVLDQPATVTEPEVKPQPPSPEEVPETPKRTESLPIERPTPQKTAPHHSPTTSKLSRQTQLTQPQPSSVASPEMAPSQPRAMDKIEARTAAIAPRKSASELQRPSPKETPQTLAEQPKIQEARRATANQPQVVVAQGEPTPRKSLERQAAAASVAVAPQSPPTSQQQPAPSQAQPTRSLERQQAASPLAQQQQPADLRVADNVPAPQPAAQPRQQPAPLRPTLARNDRAATTRTDQAVAQPTHTAVVVPELPAADKAQPRATVEAPTADVARRTAAAPQPTPPRMTVADISSNAPATAMARTRPSDSTTSQVPALLAREAPSETPRTASQLAAAPASPAAIASPAAAQSSEPNPRAIAARKVAIDRGAQGITGGGAQRNFEAGEPAAQSVTDVASSSARRERATSAVPNPTDLATSSPARVARDRAAAEVASSTLKADLVEVAQQAGAQQPAAVDATASAALKHSAAATAIDRATAEAGSGDVDFGPTQVSGSTGVGRAGGGGEPEVNLSTQVPDASRLAMKGGAELAASDVPAVATVPVVQSEATGGGRPEAPEADSRDVAATRVDSSTGKIAAGSSAASEAATLDAAGAAPTVASARAARSSAAEALPGAVAGGGTGQPSRETGVTLASTTKAEVPVAESGPGNAEQPQAADAAGQQIARQESTSGVQGSPTGAAAGETELSADLGSLAAGATRGLPRAETTSVTAAPAGDVGGAPLKAIGEANLPGVAHIEVDQAEVAGGGPKVEKNAGPIESGAGEGTTIARRQSGGATVLVSAEEAVGGLGDTIAPTAGNVSQKAQRFSELVAISTDERFQRRDVGGPKTTINTYAPVPGDSFKPRLEPQGRHGGVGAPPRPMDPSIVSGLEFLRRHQSAGGSWSLHHFGTGKPGYESERPARSAIHSDVAATGLALLAFLGARHHHMETEGDYNDTIRNALEYLVREQQASGEIFVVNDPRSAESTRFYSHAIATLALCEAYGMTSDPMLREPAQKAIDYAVAAQHKELGGWRYSAQESSDTSVTGWMFGALDAGVRSGLKVPPAAFEGINRWLELATAPGSDGARYVYNPNAASDRQYNRDAMRRASPVMTAVGLYVRLTRDWKADDPRLRPGIEYLRQHLPDHTAGMRNTYFWYYATQVMYHAQGEAWQEWQRKLYEELTTTQVKEGPMAGSWNPRGEVPDRWGPQAGRIYVTAMNLLSLEARSRVHDSPTPRAQP